MRPVIDGHVFQHVAESFTGIVAVEPDPFRSELRKTNRISHVQTEMGIFRGFTVFTAVQCV